MPLIAVLIFWTLPVGFVIQQEWVWIWWTRPLFVYHRSQHEFHETIVFPYFKFLHLRYLLCFSILASRYIYVNSGDLFLYPSRIMLLRDSSVPRYFGYVWWEKKSSCLQIYLSLQPLEPCALSLYVGAQVPRRPLFFPSRRPWINDKLLDNPATTESDWYLFNLGSKHGDRINLNLWRKLFIAKKYSCMNGPARSKFFCADAILRKFASNKESIKTVSLSLMM